MAHVSRCFLNPARRFSRWTWALGLGFAGAGGVGAPSCSEKCWGDDCPVHALWVDFPNVVLRPGFYRFVASFEGGTEECTIEVPASPFCSKWGSAGAAGTAGSGGTELPPATHLIECSSSAVGVAHHCSFGLSFGFRTDTPASVDFTLFEGDQELGRWHVVPHYEKSDPTGCGKLECWSAEEVVE